MSKCQVSLVLGLSVFVLSVGDARCANKPKKTETAQAIVKEALQREIYGLEKERRKLLNQAAELDAECAQAMWHRGFVRHQNKWIKADETEQFKSDSRVALYHRIRNQYKDDAPSQWRLADWCRKRKLFDQERAHLERVIELQPNHAQARARLGFQRIDGTWVRANEFAQAEKQAATDRVNFSKWQASVHEILIGLNHSSPARRKHAEEQLAKIKDPGAIVALEASLSSDSAKLALLVLKTVDGMDDPQAPMCLARHAVFSPWPQVRQEAAERLRMWRVELFVPSLLVEMYTPVRSQIDFYQAPGGRLVYRHSYFRRGQRENRLLVEDTAYRRVALPTGNANESRARAAASIQTNAMQAEQNVAFENVRTEELNLRIGKALATATGENLAAAPDAWWAWWNDYNEIFVAGRKPTNSVYRPREVVIVDRPQLPDFVPVENDAATRREATPEGETRQPRWERLGDNMWRDNLRDITFMRRGGGNFVNRGTQFDGFRTRQGWQRIYDCLKAGTTVWTTLGPVSVEEVKVGDLVLSQDIETGELAYKPVLRTTVRPPSELVVIHVKGEQIQSSGGHPFWIAGEGWIKARNLEQGMQLHGFAGSKTISDVRTGKKEQTYNLVVADFHTYFVGNNKVLNHDNTIRAATSALVPGLASE